MQDDIFMALQRIAPQHTLSKLAGRLAKVKTPWLKNFIIDKFIDQYNVNMDEALNDASSFEDFNAFFTRELKPGARPIDSDEKSIVSPADGVISQLGDIENDKLFQAKGHHYSLQDLLANDKNSTAFRNGKFATVYLSPKDYHRVHMPITGRLISMTHVPGKLYSVNKTTAENLQGVFAKNERVICYFDSAIGVVCLILVGAMIVGSIDTVWAGEVAPANKHPKQFFYRDAPAVELNKGDEVGRFKLGSTAIVLFPENVAEWNKGLTEDSPLKMGQAIGRIF